MITTEQIKKRMFAEMFGQPLLDNSWRGLWCEYMICEALGGQCESVGAGWHAWDLQIGDKTTNFPQRVRIQVKSSARLQIWNTKNGKYSECQWDLKFRKRPNYFVKDNPNIPCEELGFMCDLYILCLHDEEDVLHANQLDPMQWKIFLVPVVGRNCAVTTSELVWARDKLEREGRASTLIRRPKTLEKGIRGRPPIKPIGISELTTEAIYTALDINC